MITIVDGICGSGKTTDMMQYMNDHRYKRFIFFTPFISECHRIAGTSPKSKTDDEPKVDKSGNVVYKQTQYNCGDMDFRDPLKKGRGYKIDDIRRLIEARENIVSSHKMFTMLGADMQQLISESAYTLVLDEVVDPIVEYTVTPNNRKEMFENGYFVIDSVDNMSLKWNYEKYPYTRKIGDNFYKEKMLADNGNLILLDDTIFLWEMSSELFSAFSEAFILTYQFEGSPLKSFFDAKGIPYKIANKQKPSIKYGDLINIIDDERLNSIGDSCSALSATQSKSLTAGVIKELQSNMNSLYKYRWGGESSDVLMWTSLSKAKDDLSLKGWHKGHIVHNIRGSNDYRHKSNCAYLYNVFLSPHIKSYFRQLGVTIDEDTYALNSLLQWLFRSRLRDGKSINLYIPSKRMRELLMKWCAQN